MATLFFIIVLLHFIVGLGWLAYKLSPRSEDKKTED
jgi:hypothetical protein